MRNILTYLREAKIDVDYERNYNDIPRDIFDLIVKMDPKTKMIDNKPELLGFGAKQLLLPKYLAGETNFIEDSNLIYDLLTQYYDNIANYPKFNEFKSIRDFVTFMNDPENASIEKAEQISNIDKLYNKYYQSIPRDIFDDIIAIDPKTNDNNIGQIAKNLLLPKYISGERDFINNQNDLKNICSIFYEDSQKLDTEKRDLTRYESVKSFIDFMTNNLQSKLVSSLKADTTIDPDTKRQVKDDIRIVASTKDYDIIEPKSRYANAAISGSYENPNGMHWCTGSLDRSYYFNDYVHSQNGRLFCFMHKDRNRGSENRDYNWQIQIKDGKIGEFLNGHDRTCYPGATKDEQFKNFLTAHPDICIAIADKEPFNMLTSVQEAFTTVEYASKPFLLTDKTLNDFLLAQNQLKYCLKEIIIDMRKIPKAACAGFLALTTVNFKEGVEIIGAQAFKGCINIETLTLPESLRIIGAEAFAGDIGLGKRSIRIPNNVTEIHTRAFMGDHCKLKIDQNRSQPITFDAVDQNWVKSHVEAIKLDY